MHIQPSQLRDQYLQIFSYDVVVVRVTMLSTEVGVENHFFDCFSVFFGVFPLQEALQGLNLHHKSLGLRVVGGNFGSETEEVLFAGDYVPFSVGPHEGEDQEGSFKIEARPGCFLEAPKTVVSRRHFDQEGRLWKIVVGDWTFDPHAFCD
jgi:hypothetical protein